MVAILYTVYVGCILDVSVRYMFVFVYCMTRYAERQAAKIIVIQSKLAILGVTDQDVELDGNRGRDCPEIPAWDVV